VDVREAAVFGFGLRCGRGFVVWSYRGLVSLCAVIVGRNSVELVLVFCVCVCLEFVVLGVVVLFIGLFVVLLWCVVPLGLCWLCWFIAGRCSTTSLCHWQLVRV
jgi:hypothetical protein